MPFLNEKNSDRERNRHRVLRIIAIRADLIRKTIKSSLEILLANKFLIKGAISIS
jgi:hypothetical protein